MSPKLKALTIGACLLAVGVAGASANAAGVRVSAAGLWASNAPTTPYSLPGKAFSFSFVMPKAYAFADYGDVKVVFPTQIKNFQYSLDNVPLSVSVSSVAPPSCSGGSGLLCDVELIDAAGGGGLTLDFSDWSVDLYGVNNVDIGSQGALKLGKYEYIPNINGDPSPIDGQINEGNGPTVGSVVPEPAAWMVMLLGLGLVGGVVRRAARSGRSTRRPGSPSPTT